MTNDYNVYAFCGLGTLLIHELVSCYMTHRSASKARGLIKGIKGWLLPSQLLCVTFAVLVVQHATILQSGGFIWYAHAAADGARPENELPVHTLTYVEWLVNVPILLILAGKCALDRPMRDVAGPIIVTNVYIILSWGAHFIVNGAVRWALVAVSFAMYAWASVDMVMWVRKYRQEAPPDSPSVKLKPWLTFGLIIIFGIYGIVYLCTLVGLITPHTEKLWFLFMDIGSKLSMSMAFAGIRSSETVDLLVNMLVQTNIPFRRQFSPTEGMSDQMSNDDDFFSKKGE